MHKLLMMLLLAAAASMATAQTYPGFEKKEYITGNDTLRYRIQYPLNFDTHKKYPLVLVLHGSGERGSDNEAQLKWGGSLFADSVTRAKFPAIVVFPQCPRNDSWAHLSYDQTDSLRFRFSADTPVSKPLAMVMQLLDFMTKAGMVNTGKIYVGGLSMGGMGTFDILWRNPRFFAAAFPICGAGNPSTVGTYALKFPIWVFHGDQDPAVPVGNSRLMVNALKAAKANVKYSEYPGVGHDSWKNAFAEPELLPWLFAQHR